MRSSASRASVAVIALVAIAASLTGCSSAPVAAPSSSPTSTPTLAPTPTTVPEPPPDAVFDPQADAETNRPVIDQVLVPLVATGAIPSGEQIVTALIEAGADVSILEVTADRTAIGLEVDSILFSVRLGDECILGQFDGDGYTSTTAPVLASGGCLIGTTVSLD
jgi:ABC-type transport system substrate-binding protein